MKKRVQKKILKRIGNKLHDGLDFSLNFVEKRLFERIKDSKIAKAFHKFHEEEIEKGTIFNADYSNRVSRLMIETLSIENLTGVVRYKIFAVNDGEYITYVAAMTEQEALQLFLNTADVDFEIEGPHVMELTLGHTGHFETESEGFKEMTFREFLKDFKYKKPIIVCWTE